MNHQQWKALNRVVSQLERRSRRSPRRFTAAPVVLGLGLLLGEYLLVGLVPRVLPVLPIAENPHAVGVERIPGLVWHLAGFCQENHPAVQGGILAFSLVLLVLSYRFRIMRPIAWLAALSSVALDALILFVIFNACLDVAAAPL